AFPSNSTFNQEAGSLRIANGAKFRFPGTFNVNGGTVDNTAIVLGTLHFGQFTNQPYTIGMGPAASLSSNIPADVLILIEARDGQPAGCTVLGNQINFGRILLTSRDSSQEFTALLATQSAGNLTNEGEIGVEANTNGTQVIAFSPMIMAN